MSRPSSTQVASNNGTTGNDGLTAEDDVLWAGDGCAPGDFVPSVLSARYQTRYIAVVAAAYTQFQCTPTANSRLVSPSLSMESRGMRGRLEKTATGTRDDMPPQDASPAHSACCIITVVLTGQSQALLYTPLRSSVLSVYFVLVCLSEHHENAHRHMAIAKASEGQASPTTTAHNT